MSDRKYRQRGYQDADSGERPARRPGPAGARSPGPRGRGLGKPTATAFRCAVCGARQPASELGFDAECDSCGADLHSCTHCRHFDTSAPAECRQPVAERIANKAKRNRCELFEPRTTQELAGDGDRPEDARAAFDALFKL